MSVDVQNEQTLENYSNISNEKIEKYHTRMGGRVCVRSWQ